MTAAPGWVARTFGIEVSTVAAPVGLEVTDLMQLALRRNPRRAHLLVSTVLGKHLPVDPRAAAAVGRLLGALVAAHLDQAEIPAGWSVAARHMLDDRDFSGLSAALGRPEPRNLLVLGYAETATSLGHLVADQLGAAWYLHSTRRPVPGVATAGTFEESHSHATSHLLLPVPADVLEYPGPVVLVDDEISTGRTALATVRELHARIHRERYVVATLLDMRSATDRAAFEATSRELGIRIDLVALATGTIHLPPGLPDAVAEKLGPAGSAGPNRSESGATVNNLSIQLPSDLALTWPGGVPDGGRHGVAREQSPDVDRAVKYCARRIRERIPPGGSIMVLGTEEFMYVPLRIAESLSASGVPTYFQSTTRSPVHPLDTDDYPIRRAFAFGASDRPAASDEQGRFVYNVRLPDGSDPDLVVLVTDSGHDAESVAAGPAAALRAAGLAVLTATVSPDGLPEPLRGPAFGAYARDEAGWLLTDLSHVDLEGDLAEREALIQSGQAHYAESLPREFLPAPEYQQLFDQVLIESAGRLAAATGVVTELVLAERGDGIVLASLARAGTPIGILMRRWARFRHGLDLPHYALSIVRGRGIDRQALCYLANRYDPGSVVFVDGWTGKGAIAKELTAALTAFAAETGVEFDDDLAVLADPGHCTRTFGTSDDFLIASACLNSTVSGLVSRTVLNPLYTSASQFHGAKFYRELAAADVSNRLLDTVANHFESAALGVENAVADILSGDRAGDVFRLAGRRAHPDRSTASVASISSSPASVKRPGSCYAGFHGESCCGSTEIPIMRTFGCWLRSVGYPSRSGRICPIPASA